MFKFNSGFTLLEILIVISILALLAALAIPIYSSHQNKIHRTEGKIALLELAESMEEFFNTHHTYVTAVANPNISHKHHYQLRILEQTEVHYLIEAEPLDLEDSECGSFRLNQLGQKMITGSGSMNACW